jgi:hypothetical protein
VTCEIPLVWILVRGILAGFVEILLKKITKTKSPEAINTIHEEGKQSDIQLVVCYAF